MKFRKKSFHHPTYIDDLHPTKFFKTSPISEYLEKQHTLAYKYLDKTFEPLTHNSPHIPPQKSIFHTSHLNQAKAKLCTPAHHQSNHLYSKPMEPSQNNREIGWSNSSNSEAWLDDEDMGDTQSHNNDDILTNTIFRRGPIIQLDSVSLERNRVLWRHCLVVYLLDRRRFSIRRMQSILNSAWRLRGSIRIAERQESYYTIHFEYPTDQEYILHERPWSVDGALLVVKQWTPNLVLNRMQLTFFTPIFFSLLLGECYHTNLFDNRFSLPKSISVRSTSFTKENLLPPSPPIANTGPTSSRFSTQSRAPPSQLGSASVSSSSFFKSC